MSMDQSYEQLKKSIKGEGGAVGLTENLKELSRIVETQCVMLVNL